MTLPVIESGHQTAVRSGNGTADITKPTGLATGDLILCGVATYNSSAAESTSYIALPTGFTEIVSVYRTGTQTGGETKFGYKIATSDDAAASTFTYTIDAGANDPGSSVGFLARATGVDPTTPIGASTSSTFLTGAGPIELPSVTAAADSILVAGVNVRAAGVAQTFSWPSPMTELLTRNNSLFATLGVGEEDITSAGATGTRTVSYTSAVVSNGVMFTINGAGTASSSVDLQNLHRGFGPARAAGLGGILQ